MTLTKSVISQMQDSPPAADGASTAAALAAIRLAGSSPIVQYFRGAIIVIDSALRFLGADGRGSTRS